MFICFVGESNDVREKKPKPSVRACVRAHMSVCVRAGDTDDVLFELGVGDFEVVGQRHVEVGGQHGQRVRRPDEQLVDHLGLTVHTVGGRFQHLAAAATLFHRLHTSSSSSSSSQSSQWLAGWLVVNGTFRHHYAWLPTLRFRSSVQI